MFGGGKPWRITGGSPNFTIQILTMSYYSRNINKANKQKFAKVFTRQKEICQTLPLPNICATYKVPYIAYYPW